MLAHIVRAARFSILDKVMQMAGLRGSQDPGGGGGDMSEI